MWAGLDWHQSPGISTLRKSCEFSTVQYQIAHDFCAVFLFYKSFSRGGHRYFAHYKFVEGGRAEIVMHASCRKGRRC